MVLYKHNFVSEYTYNVFLSYHYVILSFNLLPIYPLDGSKFLNLILNCFLSFKKSHILTIYISYTVIILCIIYFYNNLNFVFLIIILLSACIKEHKNHILIFNKFLLERYLYPSSYKKNNIIKTKKMEQMQTNKNNIFIISNKYYDEFEMLKNKFSN